MGRAKTRARGTANAGRAQACNHMSTSDAVFMPSRHLLRNLPWHGRRGEFQPYFEGTKKWRSRVEVWGSSSQSSAARIGR